MNLNSDENAKQTNDKQLASKKRLLKISIIINLVSLSMPIAAFKFGILYYNRNYVFGARSLHTLTFA